MTTKREDQRPILFIALKRDAQPVLGQLRGAGHRVSLVEDLDEAQSLLGSGGFHHVVVPGAVMAALLEKHSAWDPAEVDSWRRSVSGLGFDLENVLRALRINLQESSHLGPASAEVQHTLSTLCDYLQELTAELAAPLASDLQLSVVDLEGAIEGAAITAYPSAAERRQRLVIEVTEDVASVRVDSVKLKRMLSALLRYASRHTPTNGSVRVHAYQERDEPVICISYQGEEMTGAELRRLFSPADHDSPGGLSRVQRLAAQHECRLWLESQHGIGTSLFLALPWWSNTRSGGVPSPVHR